MIYQLLIKSSYQVLGTVEYDINDIVYSVESYNLMCNFSKYDCINNCWLSLRAVCVYKFCNLFTSQRQKRMKITRIGISIFLDYNNWEYNHYTI